jgi:hypothetical protein
MNARDELFDMAYPVVLRRFEEGEEPTPESLQRIVEACGTIIPDLKPGLTLDADDVTAVVKRIETLVDIQIDHDIIVKKGHEPWLHARRKDIDPFYWNRYRTWLQRGGLPPAVVAEMGAGTDRVLDLLADPQDELPWDRRGLVMGNVQSGKTAHYTGLVCKAADAGFRVIIIIAGIHNNLRNQTQGRIDEGFIGEHRVRERASVRREWLGVGRIDAHRRPVGFTSSTHDFTKATADAMGVPFDALNEPAVFVIKKNPTTLKNLLAWLKPANDAQLPFPLLLIDDEADNASINVAYSRDEVSAINKLIRNLLDTFSHSAYIGYTATPFANIFIDPATADDMLSEDLFPRSFIVSLDAPSNYFGATRVFIEESRSFLRWIEDAEDLLPTKHKKDHRVAQLPDSLVDAVRAFVLTRAIRIIRGDGAQHSSMLVNASRFVSVQGAIGQQVTQHLQAVQDAARLNHALAESQALTDPEIAALQRVFLSEFSAADVGWSDVLAQLWEAAAPIRVAVINGKSADRLQYDQHPQGLHVIAVGGLALSRGLTLYGLSTTYFLRNSQMYDTLLQMGRWFGYRPRYEDLCRIWIPEEVAGWYAHIAESVEELREELRKMAADGGSPADFGLKVRSHPAALIVTARNKMGAAETRTVRIGLALRNVQTSALSLASREDNIACGRELVESTLSDGALTETVPGGLLLRDVRLESVRNFLKKFRNNSYSMLTDTTAILAYLDGRAAEVALWDLFIAQRSKKDDGGTSPALGVPLNLRSRTVDLRGGRVQFRKANFLDPNDEKVGLSAERITAAEEIFRNQRPPRNGKYNYPALVYRMQRERPQMGLHLLHLTSGAPPAEQLPGPWLAWNISFPDTDEPNETTEYVVNPAWIEEFVVDDEDADEGDSDDD